MFWVNEKLHDAAQLPDAKLLSFDWPNSSERWRIRHVLLAKNIQHIEINR